MKITSKTNILITGCGGMLGDAFFKYFSPRANVLATDINLNSEWLKYLDVRSSKEINQIVRNFKPSIIFHLAALTDLEYCETHPDEAYETNTLGTENIVNICKKLNIPVLYICTAGIFDGKKEYYDDWEVANPINHYGRAKWAGEEYIKNHLSNFFICRAGWMMGGGPKKDKKFIKKIMAQISSGKKKIYAVSDKFGTPTYTHDFAKNVHKLIESNQFGVYNMVCEGDCSRYDVAREILKILRLTEKVELIEVNSNFFSKEYFAPRPFSEKLIPKKLNLRNLNFMEKWEKALKKYLCNYKNWSW